MEDNINTQVKLKGVTYNVVPEVVKKGCKGCYFINKGKCADRLDSGQKLVDICRTGFIFTKA